MFRSQTSILDRFCFWLISKYNKLRSRTILNIFVLRTTKQNLSRTACIFEAYTNLLIIFRRKFVILINLQKCEYSSISLYIHIQQKTYCKCIMSLAYTSASSAKCFNISLSTIDVGICASSSTDNA
jgi:hypothetical protein